MNKGIELYNPKHLISATIAPPIVPNFSFVGNDGSEILRLDANGDIFVKGKLVENDKQVVDGMRAFLTSHNRY